MNEIIAMPQPVTTQITQLALKRRWPRLKWRAMLADAPNNETIADFQDSLQLATYVDLSDSETRNAVNYMTLDIVPITYRLTAEEANAILNTPVADNEKPIY